jgi:hypothetical protein
MNAPIRLRPDAGARRQAERRSFMRAAAAAFIGHRDREDPVKWVSEGSFTGKPGTAEVDGYGIS